MISRKIARHNYDSRTPQQYATLNQRRQESCPGNILLSLCLHARDLRLALIIIASVAFALC